MNRTLLLQNAVFHFNVEFRFAYPIWNTDRGIDEKIGPISIYLVLILAEAHSDTAFLLLRIFWIHGRQG